MSDVLGFDVGGTHVRGVRVSRTALERGGANAGSVKIRWRDGASMPSPADLAGVLRSAAAELGVPRPDAVGLGIAAQLSADGSVVRNAPNLGWRDLEIQRPIAETFGLEPHSVSIDNDVNAILEGERSFGAGQGFADILAVYVGTGIGGALVCGGALQRGAGGNAGEIGHVKLPGFVGSCGCGQVGCVEAFAGGRAILERLQHARATGESAFTEIAEVDRAANAGDPWARSFAKEIAVTLGSVIADAVTILNPGLLLLGGGVLDRAPWLRGRLEAAVRARALAVAGDDLTIARGTLGDSAGTFGAAAIAIRRLPVLNGR